MARTPGAKNKVKTINVPLSKLNELFKDNALIEVSAKYINLLNLTETEIQPVSSKIDLPPELGDDEQDPKPQIQFEIRMPTPKNAN
jgi:hypothetical protein